MEKQKDLRSSKETELAKTPKVANKSKKHADKSSGDAAYSAFQQRNDRTGTTRHAGESEMNDENRSGGSNL
jgi:hypothetical protein